MFERRQSSRNDPAFLLAILYTSGFFGFLMRMTYSDIPPVNKEMINQIIPILGVIQAGIVQYFYQKQAQVTADRKDDTIKQLTDKATEIALNVPTVPVTSSNTNKTETGDIINNPPTPATDLEKK